MFPNVIDLADVKRRADERDAITRAAVETKASKDSEERFKQWDAAMQRAFKGIVPRPERHKLMYRALNKGAE